MLISSPAFGDGGRIPLDYTCDGANVSPPLVFSGVPESAASLALTMDDPDAPAGTFIHWTVFNIDPRSTGIEQGGLPEGAVQGRTSTGRTGYFGPCPPSGTHRYFFRLYALDTQLPLGADASARELESAMEGHVIETAGFYGAYSRTA